MSDVDEVTAAVRAADRLFESEGGGSRHYVRDCLLPEFERRGLRVVAVAAPSEISSGEGTG